MGIIAGGTAAGIAAGTSATTATTAGTVAGASAAAGTSATVAALGAPIAGTGATVLAPVGTGTVLAAGTTAAAPVGTGTVLAAGGAAGAAGGAAGGGALAGLGSVLTGLVTTKEGLLTLTGLAASGASTGISEANKKKAAEGQAKEIQKQTAARTMERQRQIRAVLDANVVGAAARGVSGGSVGALVESNRTQGAIDIGTIAGNGRAGIGAVRNDLTASRIRSGGRVARDLFSAALNYQ